MRKLLFITFSFALSLGFLPGIGTGSSSAQDVDSPAFCQANGLVSYEGRCVTSEERSCLVGGGSYDSDGGCECPTGQELDGSVCVFTADNNSGAESSSCNLGSSFLGFPTWYRGLVNEATCDINIVRDDFRSASETQNPALIIATNILAILSRLAGIIVVIFMVVGGFKYVLSDGDPQRTAEARKTIINAFVGVIIVAVAATVIEIIYNALT